MTRSTFRTRTLESTPTGQLTELLVDDGTSDDVLVCAAHGGRIEPGTAEQAIALTARLPTASCWACLGYDDVHREFDRWHPPSSAFSPAEYPLLGEIADRGFETVISFHGLSDDRVLVGGAINSAVKARVVDRLDPVVSVPVDAVDGGPYGGVSPDNFVNWLAAGNRGGLQIEAGRSVRTGERETVVSTLDALVRSDQL